MITAAGKVTISDGHIGITQFIFEGDGENIQRERINFQREAIIWAMGHLVDQPRLIEEGKSELHVCVEVILPMEEG